MKIYKKNGTRSMEMDEEESIAMVGIWNMEEGTFDNLPRNYFANIQGKRIRLCDATLNEPKPPENSELSLDN